MSKSPAEAAQAKKNGASSPKPRLVLRLYVAGLTSRSSRAIANVRAVCEELLDSDYELEVIDIYRLPSLAKADQILATPTLVRAAPSPLKRCIGVLSREELIAGLGLRPRST